MAIDNPQLNELLDGGLRTAAEHLRATKSRINSLWARWQPLIAAVPNDASEMVVFNRTDAASLPAINGKDIHDFCATLGTIRETLLTVPDDLVEKFCVRTLEVSQ